MNLDEFLYNLHYETHKIKSAKLGRELGRCPSAI